tara:strand:- start:5834 stop:6223 length:390 start_codon:yes stop_codon:yes gene_type:complete
MKNWLLLSLFVLTACASSPQLYPNAKYKSVGKDAADADVKQCMAEAEEYLKSSKAKQITKGAGSGGIVGAAVGAVSGAFTGNIGRGALRGGALGATAGGAAGAISPDQLKQRYVNHCLQKKGYKVIGWD